MFNLNDIQLDPYLLVKLYGQSLTENEGSSFMQDQMKEKKPIQFLGGLKKNIAIITSSDKVPVIEDGALNFLLTIITACKLTLEDIAIINAFYLTPEAIQTFISDKEVKQVILLGTEPASIGLPIHFPSYQLQHFNNRIYLHAPGLYELENNKPAKMNLWTSLKTLFAL